MGAERFVTHHQPMRRLLFSSVILAAFAINANAREKVVAYVPNWIDLESFAKEIDYGKVTHLNIAFENAKNDEGDLSFNRKNQALITAARAKKIPVLISIGGGAASGDKTLLARYGLLLSREKRAAFAAKLARYVEEHGFDGLDVDLEGPSITDDYGPFIAELSTELKPIGKLLTSALSKGYGGNKVPDDALAHFDFVNIMAYDGAGYWAPNSPGQHSSMAFAKDTVAYWLKRGIPKSKAVLGVPFYGYGFGAAFKKRDYPFAQIVAAFPGAENADQIGDTIWYNGIPTIKAKAQFARDTGLGGVMIWSLDNDARGEKSLLNAIDQVLSQKTPDSPAN